ncbi:MAG: serine/threonine-protein kinase, partial [Gemmatimonadota bacterium]|nr:serine/threonine-protein kinase [Gemmatimonadota bacterium]
TPDISTALGDRYVIEREIGSGGMAVVYLARDKKLDREVALKVLRPELGAVLGSERFLTEIKISARLDHPHILTLIDSGEADGLLYYVLPFVRGESLRAKLDRERQLGLEEALTITKQVASALDYAHRQGLVHRDIKPENILIQEGEAMLTDFGIALAVKEAGGNRLTQTGLSLGTPQYMSPEQATGDRGIDARSDVYSLASVLYEMLAGEPPVTGASAQSMIAKLMTEKPTHLRVLRDTVPVAIDEAVAKALAKTPADRFASAGEFSRALDVKAATEAGPSARPASKPSRRLAIVVGALVLAAIAAGGAYMMRGRTAAPRGAAASLGQRTQLTTAGIVLVPAISPDGKQLAYVTRKCATGQCGYSIVVQDIGGSTTRSILEGATAAYYLEWSPDRRNLIFNGTFNGRIGTFLLSALGGTPRLLTSGVATFFAGGDSLLIGPTFRADSVYWIRVTGLDGGLRDSIRLRGNGQGVAALSSMPGTGWIVTMILQAPHGLWQLIDRKGNVVDRVVNACTCGGVATRDAMWVSRAGDGVGESIVRIAVDPLTGKFATRQDTMVTGLFTNFSLTEDGAGMVMDEGTYEFNVWSLDFADLLKGTYPDNRRVAHASSPVNASISPDGARLLIRKSVPVGGNHVETRFSVMPFAGGSEASIGGANPVAAFWSDSVTVGLSRQTPSGLHLAEIDVRTNAVRNEMDLPDSVLTWARALPDGWAWIPAAQDKIVVRRAGKTREYAKPPWYAFLFFLDVDPARNRIFIGGNDRTTGDSLGVSMLNLADGSTTMWATTFAELARTSVLADGSIFLQVSRTQESLSFYKLTAPGQMQSLGDSPRPLRQVSVSRDMKHATALERDYRADAWMSKVNTH